jgi:hypothetical protein
LIKLATRKQTHCLKEITLRLFQLKAAGSKEELDVTFQKIIQIAQSFEKEQTDAILKMLLPIKKRIA